MINIGFIMGHLILPNAHELGQNFSVHYFPPLCILLNQALFYLNVHIEKVFKSYFPGAKLEFFVGFCVESLKTSQDTQKRQTTNRLVINVTDERAKDPDNRYTIYNGKDF